MRGDTRYPLPADGSRYGLGVSAQRAEPMIPAENRSAHPAIPGVPWWAAILIAVAASAAGFAIDAGSRELTSVFAVLYALGCVAAVLAVRQSGIFTAVVQPPLILFVAVPGAYYFFHRTEITGIKDLLINCGYPLIERFVLMFSTSVLVLLIGMARWYFGSAKRSAAATPVAVPAAVAGLFAALRASVSRLTGARGDDDTDTPTAGRANRKHGIDRPKAAAATAERPPRQHPPATRATRSRHARPPMDDIDGPAPQPRRRRTNQTRETRGEAPRRRTPPRGEVPPREYRPDPRDPMDRHTRQSNRYNPYEPYEPYYGEPPHRMRGAPGTHHPVSNVRYRGAPDTGQDHDPWQPPRSDRRRRHQP